VTVKVTAQSVAALRAQLTGDSSFQRLVREFSSQDDRVSYSALQYAAFLEAVRRRFTKETETADVIEYVADVRSRFDASAEAIDPTVGELLILEALGREEADGIASKTSAAARMFLLTALIADERLDAPAIDRVIARAKWGADHLLNSGA
jgi:hypothetical protein